MAWTLKFEDRAKKELAKLDKPVAQRLVQFLKKRVLPLDNPRTLGEPLKGKVFGDYWKYRVGNWRIVAKIEDDTVEILVVKFGHRSEVYERV